MAAPKFRQILKATYEQHADLFEALRPIHDAYAKDQKGQQEVLNKVGEPIMVILKEAEQRLCRQTENGGYGDYSSKLADRFWQEVKKDWPYIEWIGVRLT